MNSGTEFMFIHTGVVNVGNVLLGWPWRGGFRWLRPATSGRTIDQGIAMPMTGFRVQLP